MYKTLYAVTVHPIQGGPVEFVDINDTPGAGSAVLAQLTAHKDVDSVVEGGGSITHIIIPLHAVDYAEVAEQRIEDEYEDDNAKNCTDGGSGGETGTLTIVNNKIVAINNIEIMASEKLDGTYGPVTFSSDDGGEPFPDGYQSYATVSIGAGESIEIPGLPAGMTVMTEHPDITTTATVPGTITIDGVQPG